MKSFSDNSQVKALLRRFAIEMVVYVILLVVYFLLVLRYLGEPISNLFHQNLTVYGIAALLLIVTQAAVLDWLVKRLVDFLLLYRVRK